MSSPQQKSFEQRLILPLGSKEIEFTLPPAAFSLTPPMHRRNSHKLEIPSAATRAGSRGSTPAETKAPEPGGNATSRLRSFSSAFLFPGFNRSGSPLLSPAAFFHSSAPTSPVPACTPSPGHTPCLSPLAGFFSFAGGGRDTSPSPGATSKNTSRASSPLPRAGEMTPPTVASRGSSPSPVQTGVTSSLGVLNPDLYKSPLILEEDTATYPDGHLGRVWFSVAFDRDQEKLQINLIRIRNLPSRDRDATACDPVVRIALLPGERRFQQSSVQRKTCNPIYNEVFCFCVSNKELPEQSIKITVADNSRPKKRQEIGHLICSLRDISLENNRQEMITLDLSKDPSTGSSPGEIHVSLCYYPTADRITVTVLQARNIKSPTSATPDTYVRLTLLNQTRAVKTKRTSVIRRSEEPCFNESFHFRLENNTLDSMNIVLAIHQADNKDRVLGRLVLGSFMFARGRGLAHWNDMLSHPREHVQRWHPLNDN